MMIDLSAPMATVRTRPTGWRSFLALRPSMVDFEQRGFHVTPARTRQSLEYSAGAFLAGFNIELATAAGEAPDLSAVPEPQRGFAAEGAGMAAALLDLLNPAGGRRFAALSRAYQERYVYLVMVGAGWAMAKLRRQRPGRLGAGEPLLRWLAYDGMGFCQAFFATERGMRRWSEHRGTCPPTCAIRYQGLGRSLWFRDCGEPARLAARIEQLPPEHRGDTWSGVALAATYAGGVDPETYVRLRELSADHGEAVAQGAAFAAEAWQRCGYVPPHAYAAVEALTAVSLPRAAEWTWMARRGLDGPGAGPTDYRRWRMRIQQEAAVATY